MSSIYFTRIISLAILSLCSTSFLTASNASYAKLIVNPLVYHLSSDEPWRATVAISDATTQSKLGHNVTLLLSIEGVQIGVKHPHHYLGHILMTVQIFQVINTMHPGVMAV
jgi:hypothetical protein